MKEKLVKVKIVCLIIGGSFLTSFFLSSCSVARIAYFKDLPDTTNNVSKYIKMSDFKSPTIEPDDIISVIVQTIDPNANHVLNEGNIPLISGGVSGIKSGQVQNAVQGYLVNKLGIIHMPFIGDVTVQGYTCEQVRDTIIQKMQFYYKEPTVNVRFANFKITVLGDVNNPGTFIVPNEKPTILDAIGLAGDMTIYGRRDNVMVIRDRDNGGQKEVVRLDMDSLKSIKSPYFFLKPNDVVYVESSASRVQSTDAYRTRDIAIIGASLALLTVILSRLIR